MEPVQSLPSLPAESPRLMAVVATGPAIATLMIGAWPIPLNDEAFTMSRVIPGQIPHDAKLISVNWEAQRQAFLIILSSASFEPLAPGSVIPIIDLQFESFMATKFDGGDYEATK